MSAEASSPFDSFIFLTNRVGRLLSNSVRRHSGHETLAHIFPHMGVLVDLWVSDGQRQQELASSLIKDKGTIARSLDVLEQHGMVERRPDPSDRRTKRIFLTEAGSRLRLELREAADEVIGLSVRGIAPRDVDTCRTVLQRMYCNLHSEEK